MRLNYRRTLLLSSAFWGVQVLFAIYNAYLPILLQSGRVDFNVARTIDGFGLSTTATGFIMTLDNLAALVILPYVGVLSDATTSRMGQRKPYLLFGAPVTALAFAALPWLLGRPLWVFILVVIVVVIAVDSIRTPIFALMPDITPSPLRSQANGVINVVGGVGAMVGFLVGGALFGQSVHAPFTFGAAALVVGCLLVVAFLPVPPSTPVQAPRRFWAQLRMAGQNQKTSAVHGLSRAWHKHNHSLLYLLGAIFCLFLAFSVLTVFWTSFAIVRLRAAPGQEAQLLTVFALAIVLFALPSGLLGARIGRKRAIMLGIGIFAAATTPIALLTDFVQLGGLLTVSGLGWALIVVNAFPMVLDSAPMEQAERIGAYTGLYFLATQAAEVVGPVLTGGLLDLTGRDYRLIFGVTLLVSLAAIAMLSRVQSDGPSLKEVAHVTKHGR